MINLNLDPWHVGLHVWPFPIKPIPKLHAQRVPLASLVSASGPDLAARRAPDAVGIQFAVTKISTETAHCPPQHSCYVDHDHQDGETVLN